MNQTTTIPTDLLTTVQDNYLRFGQGEVPGILATLADDIVWSHAGNPDVLSFAGTFRGKADVLNFFRQVGEQTRISVFEPRNFHLEGNRVSNEVHIEGTAVPTGRFWTFASTATWLFNTQGLVSRVDIRGDMSAVEAAYR